MLTCVAGKGGCGITVAKSPSHQQTPRKSPSGPLQFGQLALKQPAPTEAGRGGRGGRGQSPRLQSANAHYLIGLGYLGLGDAAKAKAELAQAVETSPDLLGARSALAALK